MDKYTDAISLLQRPIAFHPILAKLTGSVNAGLMLSQALYWTQRTTDGEGWFYKTQEDWELETCLTRREQEGARKKLRAAGFWQEKRRGLPPKLYFRLDLAALNDKVIAFANLHKSAILDSKRRNPHILNVQKRHLVPHKTAISSCVPPESTTKNTTETTGADAPGDVLLKNQKSEEEERTTPTAEPLEEPRRSRGVDTRGLAHPKPEREQKAAKRMSRSGFQKRPIGFVETTHRETTPREQKPRYYEFTKMPPDNPLATRLIELVKKNPNDIRVSDRDQAIETAAFWRRNMAALNKTSEEACIKYAERFVQWYVKKFPNATLALSSFSSQFGSFKEQFR